MSEVLNWAAGAVIAVLVLALLGALIYFLWETRDLK